MFVGLLMDGGGIEALAERARQAWDDAVRVWTERRQVVLFDEAGCVLTRAVCDWAGIPLEDDEVGPLARDLQTMVDGFATAGPAHWKARLARRRREASFGELVRQVRDGRLDARPGSALAVVADHRDSDGELLHPRVAAVELINVIRPTVAISWFLAFSGHALIRWPQYRSKLASGEPAFAEAWAHEVRRFYPFAPFIGGRVPQDVEWDGQRIPEGAMVLLDIYGQLHDPELWGDPYTFRPERFLDREITASDLVPQGGGDPRAGHRCPGEQITVSLLATLAIRLARLRADVPEQDLSIPLRRIPARPRSGIVLQVHGSD
jgi:fatty-acid peroxygenase